VLTIDNGGWRGTNTLLTATEPFDLVISGGAMVHPSATITTNGNVLIRSNGWLTHVAGQTPRFIVNGDLTVNSGGGIIADGTGNQGAVGNGFGGSYSSTNGLIGGGGGHGGYGAAGSFTNAVGGNSYDSITQPTSVGSGGGNGKPEPRTESAKEQTKESLRG